MTVSLGQPVTVGGVRVAALSDTGWQAIDRSGAVLLSGYKRPLALLLQDGAIFCAVSTSGEALQAHQVDAICPGARSAFGWA